ncbi:MAG: ABC transporter ATP-binding protein [Lachnospiraceae bacterium]|nr:ABC transporter ATP-binding protein [Lachnospiraceae bacterium]
MNAITVNNLIKDYKEHRAVKGISFEVKEGELFAFLGENGAGKSTTINILSTILQKTSGEVKVFDNVLGEDDDKIRSLIGIVFQNSVLDDKLTVKENLYTRGSYYGLTKKQTDERLAEFREGFELDEIWNRRYDKLSGGQRRRVDIARALIHDPRILFLDEPTTGLDPKSRKIVWDHIDYLRREKKMTIFLTTHYMEETKDADNVVILDKGAIIAQGTPAELKTGYASSRLVWYTEESDENAGILKGMDYTYDSDHYNVKFRNSITDLLYEYKNKITDFEIIKGSMDDVFLNLTGREIANI